MLLSLALLHYNIGEIKLKNPIHLTILFIILIGSDLFISFLSHYIGKTNAVFSLDAFAQYITTLNPFEFALVFGIALLVCFLVYIFS